MHRFILMNDYRHHFRYLNDIFINILSGKGLKIFIIFFTRVIGNFSIDN